MADYVASDWINLTATEFGYSPYMRVVKATLTTGGAYNTGGLPLPANGAMGIEHGVDWVVPMATVAIPTTGDGVMFAYDPATQKLVCFRVDATPDLLEVADTTDLAGLTVVLLVGGS